MFKFDADLSTCETGVWVNFEGSSFLVAHISNMRFQRALARLQQPHRKKIEAGSLDPQVHREVICKAMAEAILLDWKDVGSIRGGDVVKYSSANALAALMGNTEFRDFISEFATNLSNYRSEEVEDLGKA
jgi:predicted amino acid racemase